MAQTHHLEREHTVLINWPPYLVIWGVEEWVSGLNLLSSLLQPTRVQENPNIS